MLSAAGNTGKDYRAKYRTLHFNLKDANNPALRSRVLREDLAPSVLVQMSAHELASKVRLLAAQTCRRVCVLSSVLHFDLKEPSQYGPARTRAARRPGTQCPCADVCKVRTCCCAEGERHGPACARAA